MVMEQYGILLMEIETYAEDSIQFPIATSVDIITSKNFHFVKAFLYLALSS